MTLYEYKLLDEREQIEAFWDKGVHLAERSDGEYSILLYQIEGFYVEVFYHKEHNNIVRLRSFFSTGQLRPYLHRVDVSGLP